MAMLQQIIDRRLSGKNKSIGNRERFLRRYREQIGEAVRRAVSGRSIRDLEQGEDITLPRRDVSEPVFGHGQGGNREYVHPGNREYVKGDRIERPQRRRRRGQRLAGRRRRGRRGRLRLPPHQGRVHAGLLRRPRPAPPDPHPAGRGAGMEEPPRRLHQRRHAQQPARRALDARRPGAAHRARRRRRGANCASSKRICCI